MSDTISDNASIGTVHIPTYYEGPTDINGDVRINQRYFAYRTGAYSVFGKTLNVVFTIDRPAKEVWPYFKDYNLWQNSYHHYYSGVAGDLEGKAIRISGKPNESDPQKYRDLTVLKVIPEYLIILVDGLTEDLKKAEASPDFQTFMLNEHDGKTEITCLMQHASATKDKIGEETFAHLRKVAQDSQMKWRDIFIPNLRKLIYERQ
jgi:hypothetical protein